MITATHFRNPLQPLDRVRLQAAGGTTLRQMIPALAGVGVTDWPQPTVALVNGSPRLRATWDDPVPAGAVVEFRSLPRGGGGLSRIGAAAIASISMQFTATMAGAAALGGMANGFGANIPADYINFAAYIGSFGLVRPVDMPDVPSYLGGETGSPTYSINYKANRKRVGEAIPVLYGHHRLFPDLVTRSHVWFQDNDQYVAAVMCLGVGEFDIDTTTLRFGEAKFSELDGIDYQIVPPGGSQTLVSDHVTTSEAVSGQTLVGPSPNVALQGAPTVAFSSYNDGTDHAVFLASAAIFAGRSPGESLIVTGTTNYNGTFVIETVDSTAQVTVSFTGTPASESPRAAVIVKSPSTPLITLPAQLTFTTGIRKIESATGAGAFTGIKPGDILSVTNTASNNGTRLVQTVADDLSYLTVQEAVTNETALNAGLAFDGDGWTGWFEAAGSGEVVEDLAVDLTAGRGLGTINDDGGISSRTITVSIQYQGLDTAGDPAGSILTRTIVITGAQQKAIRRTEQWTNDTGYDRVQLRARRTTSQSTSTKAMDDMSWVGLKAYLPNVTTYPGVTILAVRAKSSEQLSGAASGQINVEATRKVPIWNGTAWSAPTATSSIAWAIADALRSTDYGAGLPDDEIDLAALLDLDGVWSSRGDEFNAVFDQTATIWEAVQRIARAGRSQPILAGGVVTFIRDGIRTLRTAMFSPSNTLPGSLSIDYKLPQDGDPDGTSVAWIDPATWQPAHIDVIEGGGTPVNPQAVDLFGVTIQAQAQREAVYLDRVRKYQRKQFRWHTEMDGHLVNVGDRVVLAHDVPSWGQSGEMLDVDGTTYTSSQELTWTPSATHYALFRRPDGSVAGPFVVTEHVSDPYKFICPDALDFAVRTDLSNGDRTAFLFGPSTNYAQDVVVVSVAPRDAVTVEIQGVPYDERIHAAGA
jgi:hypothetical protein